MKEIVLYLHFRLIDKKKKKMITIKLCSFVNSLSNIVRSDVIKVLGS